MNPVENMLQDLTGTKPATGPRGGNLNNPAQAPAFRQAHLTAPIDPATGLPGLHSSKKSPNFRDTAVCGRQSEPPWARLAAFMLLAGRTNIEIAMAAGVQKETVSQLRGNRWFQELLSTLANEAGEDILGLVRSESVASIEKIVEIRDSAESDKTRLAAAVWLAEQSTGKAIQKVQSVNVNRTYSSPDEELADITRQLAELRAAREKTLPATTVGENQTTT